MHHHVIQQKVSYTHGNPPRQQSLDSFPPCSQFHSANITKVNLRVRLPQAPHCSAVTGVRPVHPRECDEAKDPGTSQHDKERVRQRHGIAETGGRITSRTHCPAEPKHPLCSETHQRGTTGPDGSLQNVVPKARRKFSCGFETQ